MREGTRRRIVAFLLSGIGQPDVRAAERFLDRTAGFLQRLGQRLAVLLLFQFIEFVEYIVGRFARVGKDARRRVLRGFQLALRLLTFGVELLFCFIQQPFGFGTLLFGGAFFLFQRAFRAFELGEHIFKLHAFGGHTVLCFLDDRRGNAQALRDCECVGFARQPDDEPVGGLERVYVEFAGGVAHVLIFHRVGFQFRVVRRRRDQRAQLPHVLENRHRKRRALSRVRAGAQLVEQHQRAAVADVQNGNDVDHM